MEGHCSTGQSPQWVVLQMEEEGKEKEKIVKWIKEQRISWLGHLEGMVEDRMHKKIFTQELEEGEDPGKDGKRK